MEHFIFEDAHGWHKNASFVSSSELTETVRKHISIRRPNPVQIIPALLQDQVHQVTK